MLETSLRDGREFSFPLSESQEFLDGNAGVGRQFSQSTLAPPAAFR